MENELIKIISQSEPLMEVLGACHKADLPNHYVAGGAITQAVWNSLSNQPKMQSVKDFDVIYFNGSEDITAQKQHEQTLNQKLSHGIDADVKNQALVHTWYPQKFGKVIDAYQKTEDGILSWLPAFAIGARLKEHGGIEIYAPYGLDDCFRKTIRPNKKVMPEGSYTKMCKSFRSRWPDITVMPWKSV